MSDVFEIPATPRQDLGKGASRRLRREANLVPAILYGGDQDAKPLSIPHNDLLKALKNEAFYSHILTINIDGKKEKAVVKAIQRHPYKPKVAHLDFLRVSAKDPITMPIPLHFENSETAIGVKQKGGILTHNMTELEIKCLPQHLPEFITIDVGQMDLDDSIHLSQIQLPEHVELATPIVDADHDSLVATIQLPRVAAEPEPSAAETEATAEKTEEESKSESDKKAE